MNVCFLEFDSKGQTDSAHDSSVVQKYTEILRKVTSLVFKALNCFILVLLFFPIELLQKIQVFAPDFLAVLHNKSPADLHESDSSANTSQTWKWVLLMKN